MKKITLVILSLVLVSCLSEEEAKKKAENAAKFAAEKQARIAKGVGEALKGEGKDAAESVSEGVGEVAKGFNTGFDKSLMKVNVQVAKDLQEYVKLGRAGKYTNDTTQTTDVVLYLINEKDLKTTLVIKAFDKDSLEIGRQKVSIDKKSDDAGYVQFSFDKRTPLSLATHYELIKK